MKVSDIVSITSELTGFSTTELLSPRRNLALVEARRAMTYIVCEYTSLSFSEIGRQLDKDHTTIIESYHKAKRMLHGHNRSHQFAHVVYAIMDQIIRRYQNGRHYTNGVSFTLELPRGDEAATLQ